jgi:hypothetical protein
VSSALKGFARPCATAGNRCYDGSFGIGVADCLAYRATRRRTRCWQVSGVGRVAAWDVGHDWMLASVPAMALASFGLVSSCCTCTDIRFAF